VRGGYAALQSPGAASPQGVWTRDQAPASGSAPATQTKCALVPLVPQPASPYEQSTPMLPHGSNGKGADAGQALSDFEAPSVADAVSSDASVVAVVAVPFETPPLHPAARTQLAIVASMFCSDMRLFLILASCSRPLDKSRPRRPATTDARP